MKGKFYEKDFYNCNCIPYYFGFKISKSRSFQFFGEIINKVNTQEKVIALTFDDGPTDKTDEILELLERWMLKQHFI